MGVDLSVVIVNYNAGIMLANCLSCLTNQTLKEIEIIVVDNNSVDGSLEILSNYPQVILIRNNENLGFATGQNQGFRQAQGQYVMALNYDLYLPPDFLENLLTGLKSEPRSGWACGKLLNMSPAGDKATTIYAVGHEMPPSLYPSLRGNGEEDIGQYDTQEWVFGAPGAAALYRREFIDEISLDGQFFDESFFTWYEDVDVDWRGNNYGWKCRYIPAALAYHQGHVGEKYREPFLSFYVELTVRNRWLMILGNVTDFRKLFSIHVLKYEFSLFRYVLMQGHIKAYLRAIYGIFLRLAPIQKKRTQNVKKYHKLFVN